MSLRRIDKSRYITGHDACGSQGLTGMGQQAFIVHVWRDLEHLARSATGAFFWNGIEVMVERAFGGVVEFH